MTNPKIPKSLEELMKLVKQAKSEGADVKFVNAETGEEGMPEELAEMLARAVGHDASTCHDCSGGITDSGPDAAKALLNIVSIHAHPPVFPAGTFVRYRDDIKYVRDRRALHCVVERLDAPLSMAIDKDSEGSNTLYRRYDCYVAKYSKIGGVVIFLADSRELEIYPDADKLLGRNS